MSRIELSIETSPGPQAFAARQLFDPNQPFVPRAEILREIHESLVVKHLGQMDMQGFAAGMADELTGDRRGML